MKKVLFIILLSTFFNSNAQQTDFSNQRGLTLDTFEKHEKDVEGNPFVQEKSQPIIIVGFKEKNLLGRYNAYSDYFEIINDGVIKSFHPINTQQVKFIGYNKTYKSFKVNDKPSFFVVDFFNDKYQLLIKEIVVLNKEVRPKTGYDEYTPPTFSRKKDVFYIKYNDNSLKIQKVHPKKKSFLAYFGENAKQIKSFINSNKLNYKRKEDLIKIIDFYLSIR